jgi:hypothetical protein
MRLVAALLLISVSSASCAAQTPPALPATPTASPQPAHPYRSAISIQQMEDMLVKVAQALAGESSFSETTGRKVAQMFGLRLDPATAEINGKGRTWQGLSADGLFWITVVYDNPTQSSFIDSRGLPDRKIITEVPSSARKRVRIEWLNQRALSKAAPCASAEDTDHAVSPLGWMYHDVRMMGAPFFTRKDTPKDGVVLYIDRQAPDGALMTCISELRISQPQLYGTPPGTVI